MKRLLAWLTGAIVPAAMAFGAQAQLKPNQHGVIATTAGITLEVTALRDDVLRVREWHDGHMPEDASWAVLPKSRTARATVQADQYGFHTASLRVAISPDMLLTVTDMQGRVVQQDAEAVRWNGRGFHVYKRQTPEDHFYGLGDKPGPLDRAGQSFVMWNTDNFGWQESTDPIYKSVPFFIDFHSGVATGVLFDNTWRTFFDFGHETVDEYSFGAPDGPLDYYIVYGPEPKKVIETYAWLTGPSPLPPLWSLGFQQSRYSYMTATRLKEVADRLRSDRIPADALYLDIDYQDKNRPFTVNAQAFPDFAGMVKKLAAEHFHLVLITDLHIADLPGQGYAPYDSGAAGDHFVKNANGSTYVGPVWPGASVFPDFTQQSSRAWWGSLYKQFVADGVGGFWNDMNEPAVFRYPTKTMPLDVQHRIDEPGFAKRVASHPEIHNVYGMENTAGTYEGLLKLAPNERPFVLTRASYAGGQRFAATWTGDNSATWNHLRMTTPQLLNLGLSGFAMAGADVGGFAGSPPADLLTKWLEVAAFQPIDRDHSAKGTRDHEPWVDGPEHEAMRRKYIEERYRLMPYLYTVAEEMSRTGLPIVRPLFLEFPHDAADGHPLDSEAGGEFLLGSNLLIAPNPSPEEVAPYAVRFPRGGWYDYWTGTRVKAPEAISGIDLEKRDDLQNLKPLMITPTLAEVPVYARAGSILPLGPLTQSTGIMPGGSLTLRIYTGAANTPCHGEVYQDDGHTFNYRNGAYARAHFTCRLEMDGALTIVADAREGSFKPWWSALRFEVFGWTPVQKIAIGARGRSDLRQAGTAWVFETGDDGRGFSMTLR